MMVLMLMVQDSMNYLNLQKTQELISESFMVIELILESLF